MLELGRINGKAGIDKQCREISTSNKGQPGWFGDGQLAPRLTLMQAEQAQLITNTSSRVRVT
jgi:hypothetical protein